MTETEIRRVKFGVYVHNYTGIEVVVYKVEEVVEENYLGDQIKNHYVAKEYYETEAGQPVQLDQYDEDLARIVTYQADIKIWKKG